MHQVKPFRSYWQQVELLQSRGMHVDDPDKAAHQLAVLNYYRLSGYWHSMRVIDRNTKESLSIFRPGASFDLAVALYDFDEQLRNAAFAGLARIELAMRALIGRTTHTH